MQNVKYVPLGYQQLTAAQLASAVGLTPPAGATIAVLNPETAGVRWRDDFTSPTATVGMLIAMDDFYEYWGNLSAIKFIAAIGSPLLNISYYRAAG